MRVLSITQQAVHALDRGELAPDGAEAEPLLHVGEVGSECVVTQREGLPPALLTPVDKLRHVGVV